MPTAFTESLVKNNLDFRAFVMLCTRGMGATIMMRDDPFDAPIPERFEPSDYHAKCLREAKDRLELLKSMKPAESRLWARAELKKLVEECNKQLANQQAENRLGRYRAMLAQVQAWQPPTADHQGLKDFMTRQLEESMEFDHTDYYAKRVAELNATTPETYFLEQIATASHDIDYHSKEYAEEVQRTESRNRWLKQLRDALDAGPTEGTVTP